jgi:hypothetical protein
VMGHFSLSIFLFFFLKKRKKKNFSKKIKDWMENIVVVGTSFDREKISGSYTAQRNLLKQFQDWGCATTLETELDVDSIRTRFPDKRIIVLTQQHALVPSRQKALEEIGVSVIAYAHGVNQVVNHVDLVLACSERVQKSITLESQPQMILHPLVFPVTLAPLSEQRGIVFAGTYGLKGHRIIVEIAKAMPEEIFYCFCDGKMKSVLLDAEESGPLGVYTDPLPLNILEMPAEAHVNEKVFPRAKLVLMPSRFEGCPMFATEAIHNQVLCLSTDVPGFCEAYACDVLPEDICVKERYNIDEWVRKIKELLQTPLQKRQKRAQKMAKAHTQRQQRELEILKSQPVFQNRKKVLVLKYGALEKYNPDQIEFKSTEREHFNDVFSMVAIANTLHENHSQRWDRVIFLTCNTAELWIEEDEKLPMLLEKGQGIALDLPIILPGDVHVKRYNMEMNEAQTLKYKEHKSKLAHSFMNEGQFSDFAALF